jgi:hypothetical protein
MGGGGNETPPQMQTANDMHQNIQTFHISYN